MTTQPQDSPMPQQSHDSPHWGLGTGLTTEVMLEVVDFMVTAVKPDYVLAAGRDRAVDEQLSPT